MTNNNTKVYEMFLDGIYQHTGSTKILADYIGTSRQTLERYLYEGNDKGYTFEHIGKYAQIYALYNKEVFMMFGTLEQLSECTGMPMSRLKWFRTPSSEKRGGHYQVIKIEGEYEVVKELPETRLTVYEYKTKSKQATGTAEELSKLLGIKTLSVLNHAIITGYKYPQVKAVDMNSSETFYGTATEVSKFSGMTEQRINKILRHDHHSPNWKFTYTGKYVKPGYGHKEGVVKQTKIKPQYSHKPVPMSEYGKQLFEWSTRHLRRDA